MIKYIFGIITITILFLFKPVTSHFIEDYASELLEQKVKVTSISIIPLRADAYIYESDNSISANIISISPLKIRAYYSGDIDAFKTYHPLKGHSEATADISYDKKLIIEGEASLYGADAKVMVKQLKESWYVGVDAKSLNLKTLQEQNGKEVKADAVVDFDFNLYTDANISLSNISLDLRSEGINISGTHIKDVDLKINYEKERYKIVSSFKPANFYKTSLDANGTLKDGNITASTNIAFKNVKIDIDRLKIDAKTLETSLHTSSFGGHLDATYKKDMLYYNAKNLHLSKVLKATEQKPHARGYLNLKGKLNTKTLDTDFLFSSPWIVADKQRIEKIKLSVPDLKYRDKKLTTSYRLNAAFMKKLFSFNGDVEFKDVLKLNAKSSDFKGKTTFNLKDNKFNITMKNIDIKELLKFTSQEPHATGLIDLDANGDFEKVNFSIKTDAKVKKRNIHAEANGSYNIKSKLLASDFKASVPIEKKSFDVGGKLSYKNHLKLHAHSSSFSSQTLLTLEGEHFKFYTHDLNLHELASALNKPKIIYGLVDITAEGNLKDIDFKIKSEELRRNFKLGRIENSLSLDVSGHYTPKLVTLKDTFVMHYKKEHIPITLGAKIELTPPYKSNATFINRKDKIVIHSFSYEEEQVKSDFLVDIQDLYKYRALMKNTFHGPMRIDGKYTDALNITTNSLGGEIKVNLNKSDLLVKLKEVDITKVANLIAKDGVLESGTLNGDATYEIKEKTAKTDLALSSVILNGINVDEKISTFNDAMGLDVINMSKSIISNFSDANKSQTNIEHLQFNVSLKDKNVSLDDVALSTNKFLIVSLGNLQQNGDINSLKVSIVDRNGCAIITQGLRGNIKNPKIAQTTSTLVNIVEHVPSAILNTGKKILDFGTKTIDDVASFGAQKVLRTDKKVSITSDIISESSSLIKSTSSIIMPKGCSVIYDGKVEHPKKMQKDNK
ncbi:hypothetical protein SMGD1_1983 [Sulfurimonas gotlandica GD1]|uniref:Uncharacterized protein n=1 Tax=Sulfurimonas gotlandica (strain DSM 19862 / JCM 16533 / GD1) TaxID=929558 RepID=B6BIZ3_SULGG|nr:hypothetical protein [Sulfurimonas gotlandica]EDZ63027.1 conserved hypothetical protein [Sulfurimonas gotlandica GD1]EHP30506.1 hypothetical protein SMGD1_1983 [Sulfurimonas gotlandica GD1]